MSNFMESIGNLSKSTKFGLGALATTLVAGGLYYAFRGSDGKSNDYFKYQDAKRSLTSRSELPKDLGDMMFSRNAHKDKKAPLVYGLEDESREPLRDKFQMPKGFEKRVIIPGSIGTTGPYTADHFNNVTWRGFTEDGKPNLSIFNETTQKRLNGSGKFEDNVKKELSTWRKKLPEKFQTEDHDKFYNALIDHQQYSPIRTSSENDKEVMLREGSSSGAKAKFQSQTRRSSKFGLEHQRRNDQNVAFMLDFPGFGKEPDDYNFQINKVKTGNRAGGLKSSERVPITTSEMRKAYRDKDETGTQPTFFAGGNKVQAPWEKKDKDWDTYGSYRLKKYETAWQQHDSSGYDKHTKTKEFGALKSDNQRANFLKQKWLSETDKGIPRVEKQPILVGKNAVDLKSTNLTVKYKI